MNMAKLRQILELRRATKAPPLLPPKKSKRSDEGVKRTGQQREILDIHVQLRNFGGPQDSVSGSIACAFSESESDNQKGPWRMTTASELLSQGTSVDLANVFAVEFQLENATKYIKLDICDLFSKNEAVSVGYCIFSVSELVCAKGGKIQRKVRNDESGADIADALIACTLRPKPHAVVLQFAANALSKKNVVNTSCTQVFFEIHRLPDYSADFDAMALNNGVPPSAESGGESTGAEEGSSSPKGSLLYRSESVKWNSARVLWRSFTLQSTDVLQRELRLLCFQRDNSKSAALPPISLGEFPIFYSVLRRGPGPENIYFLIYENSRHQKKTGGTFELCRLHEVCTPSFLEYIASGSSLNLAFAIDFSRSGTYVDKDLVKHYIDDVELVIGAFGETLRDFNSANMFPAFGFGAKIPPHFRESQEFCLNLDATDPYCRGISDVVAAFKSSFTRVEPLNMAHLSHVIYYMAKLAQNSLCRTASQTSDISSDYKPPNYFVLVIITRGVFDDLKETVQALIFASRAPLSIIFVGIGEDEQQLGELERLGTAGTRLNFHGRKPERDCIQYVSLPQCRKEENKASDLKAMVAERGLCAVSAQMCNWMMRNGYQKVEPIPDNGPDQLRYQQQPHHQPRHHPLPNQQPLLADYGPSSVPGFRGTTPNNNGTPAGTRRHVPQNNRAAQRMRASAQSLSMGRSSSSISFGANRFFSGACSTPGSSLSITSSAMSAIVGRFKNLEMESVVKNTGSAPNSPHSRRLPSTYSTQQKFPADSTNPCAPTIRAKRSASTRHHHHHPFVDSKSVSTTNWTNEEGENQ